MKHKIICLNRLPRVLLSLPNPNPWYYFEVSSRIAQDLSRAVSQTFHRAFHSNSILKGLNAHLTRGDKTAVKQNDKLQSPQHGLLHISAPCPPAHVATCFATRLTHAHRSCYPDYTTIPNLAIGNNISSDIAHPNYLVHRYRIKHKRKRRGHTMTSFASHSITTP